MSSYNKDAKTRQEINWEMRYANLPREYDDLLQYIRDHYRINDEIYIQEKERIESMQWNKIQIYLPLEPKTTPRPRYSSINNTFYVKGAAENKRIIQHFIHKNGNICTSTRFCVEAYFRSPTSVMKPHEVLLAEEGMIRPQITKDWDNIGKTYSDMLQEILLVNDNIIVDGRVVKYFSILPRVILTIEYLSDYDSSYNKKRVEGSKSYKKIIGNQNPIKINPAEES